MNITIADLLGEYDLPYQDAVIVRKKKKFSGRGYSGIGNRKLKLKHKNTVIKFFVLEFVFILFLFHLFLFEYTCI